MGICHQQLCWLWLEKLTPLNWHDLCWYVLIYRTLKKCYENRSGFIQPFYSTYLMLEKSLAKSQQNQQESKDTTTCVTADAVTLKEKEKEKSPEYLRHLQINAQIKKKQTIQKSIFNLNIEAQTLFKQTRGIFICIEMVSNIIHDPKYLQWVFRENSW